MVHHTRSSEAVEAIEEIFRMPEKRDAATRLEPRRNWIEIVSPGGMGAIIAQ
jgi:hypothetical protein